MTENTNERTSERGIVYKKEIGVYFVHSDGQVVTCELSNRLRKELVYPIADPSSLPHRVMQVKKIQAIDPVAVGDEVRYLDAGSGSGLIVEVLPRRSRFSRRGALAQGHTHALEQVIVANVDQVVTVFAAAQPEPKWNLLDRYLASAESLGLRALVCITKLDLVAEADGDLRSAVEEYRRIGYPVLLTSAARGQGIGELRAALAGRVSVLIGKSGVGKTSLLNALQPGLGRRVSQVSQSTGKGRHTTTNLEMFPLVGEGTHPLQGEGIGPFNGGGALVDTPGLREFGLWDVDGDNLAELFPEMRPLIGRCRYGLKCRHEREPGCAIRTAVQRGEVLERRYESFLRLREG
jgi:ribosome biogenesis GTPase